MTNVCRQTHLHALRVDSVASIFSMGGHWPYNSICIPCHEQPGVLGPKPCKPGALSAARIASSMCTRRHEQHVQLAFSVSAALMPRVSSSFLIASLIVVAFAMAAADVVGSLANVQRAAADVCAARCSAPVPSLHSLLAAKPRYRTEYSTIQNLCILDSAAGAVLKV